MDAENTILGQATYQISLDDYLNAYRLGSGKYLLLLWLIFAGIVFMVSSSISKDASDYFAVKEKADRAQMMTQYMDGVAKTGYIPSQKIIDHFDSVFFRYHVMLYSFAAFALNAPFILVTLYLVCRACYFRPRNQYRSYKGLQEEVSLLLEEGGVRFKQPNTNSLLPWTHVYKWGENKDFLLIYNSTALFHIVPKRIGQQGFPLAALREKLLEKVGKPK
jgi:hypothetical protein